MMYTLGDRLWVEGRVEIGVHAEDISSVQLDAGDAGPSEGHFGEAALSVGTESEGLSVKEVDLAAKGLRSDLHHLADALEGAASAFLQKLTWTPS